MQNIISMILLFAIVREAFPKCTEIPEEFQPTEAKKLLKKNRKLLGMVEQKFMSFMGLSGKPNRTRKEQVHVPDHMWKLFNKWNRENEKMVEQHADTARLIHSDDGERPGHINFNLSSIPKREKVHSAELLLFTEQQKRGNLPHRHLRLYTPKFENGDLVLAFYKKIHSKSKGYVKLDITDLIKDWKVNGVENSSMIVEIDRKADDMNSVHSRKRRHLAENEWQRKRPLLIVHSVADDEALTRRRSAMERSRRNLENVPTDIYLKAVNIPRVNATHEKVKKETCRLRPYVLVAKDFGWDEWIIAPNSYDLNFCSGECPKPLGPHFNTTNHAVIQNAVLGINKQLVPQLCCIPTTFKDQTFLVLDGDGNLMLKTFVEMIALGCGCH